MAQKAPEGGHRLSVVVPAGKARLEGFLGLPEAPRGVVVFAHGSGSGRFSPRNNFVALMLQQAGLATLLVDLLEESESLEQEKVFDIDLLSERLSANNEWLHSRSETSGLSIGYFGASTGAAAALQAAAKKPINVASIVSRGGRPDLAMKSLPLVKAPTLLIVGGEDRLVIPLNEAAYERLDCVKRMVIVPGATHLFEEPGTLEKVGNLACDWFVRHIVPQA